MNALFNHEAKSSDEERCECPCERRRPAGTRVAVRCWPHRVTATRTGAIAANGTATWGSGSDKRNVPCPRTAPRGEPYVLRCCVMSRYAANACGEVPCALPASSITSMETAKTMSDPICSHFAVAAIPGSPQDMTAALETRGGVAKRTWTAETAHSL